MSFEKGDYVVRKDLDSYFFRRLTIFKFSGYNSSRGYVSLYGLGNWRASTFQKFEI